MSNPGHPLEPVEGNYPSCVAVAALEFGERQGSPIELIDNLERVAEACPHNEGEDEYCLMAPATSLIGLVAVESLAEQWWPLRKNPLVATYPKEVLGIPTRLGFDKYADSLDYEERNITIEVGEEDPGLPVVNGQRQNALIYVQTHGDPAQRLFFDRSPRKTDEAKTPEEAALFSLRSIACAGMIGEKPGVQASMQVEGNIVTLSDHIDGLTFHGNVTRPTLGWLVVPKDRIVLAWSRSRSYSFELTDTDVTAFTRDF